MDPVTIIIVLVLVEMTTGGVSGAIGATAGAATEGAKAAWDETKKGAKAWGAKRATDLEKTWWGRRRLATYRATGGAIGFTARGVKAGAKAAGPGAKSGWAKGRQLRNDGARLARQKVADGTATLGAKWRQRGTPDGTPDGTDGGASGAPVGGSDEAPLAPDPTGCIFCGAPLEGAMCSNPECGASPKKHGGAPTGYAGDGDHAKARQQMLDAVVDREAGPQGHHPSVQTSSPVGEGNSKGENVSDSSFPAEKVGAAQYVPAWDTPGPQLELWMAAITTLVEEMAASAEANSHHEVGGVSDVMSKGWVVTEAIQAFGEAIAAHATALHAEHDAAIEATKGSQTQSQQDYAGAH
jgi:hypothetical protein